MRGELVVRAAAPRDLAARADLVRHGITEYDFDAFLTFFFQELTLQVCVLCGAVLFIFAGAGPGACALLAPAAAAALALAVRLAHRARAADHVQRVRKELFGFVAEYRGPLVSDPRSLGALAVSRADGADGAGGAGGAGRVGQVVGTVSVSECWGPRRSGWLHALAVAPAWRRRGAGGALLTACRARALDAGLESLEAITSELQGSARALLHTAGWQLRGSYHRPVLGAALTLSVAQLGMEIPPK